jgi:hypothetical protein
MCKNSNSSKITLKVMGNGGRYLVGWYLTSSLADLKMLKHNSCCFIANTNGIKTDPFFYFSALSSRNFTDQSLRRITRP